MPTKNLILLLGFLFSFSVFADNVAPLGSNPTEAEKQVIRDAAQSTCEDQEDDEREECVMDYFANHNLEEEPSCD